MMRKEWEKRDVILRIKNVVHFLKAIYKHTAVSIESVCGPHLLFKWKRLKFERNAKAIKRRE